MGWETLDPLPDSLYKIEINDKRMSYSERFLTGKRGSQKFTIKISIKWVLVSLIFGLFFSHLVKV